MKIPCNAGPQLSHITETDLTGNRRCFGTGILESFSNHIKIGLKDKLFRERNKNP